MRKILMYVVINVLLFSMVDNINSQNLAIKNNLLYDATTTVNLAFEVKLSSKWTLELAGNYNPWEFSNDRKLKHWLVQPEIRYWTCERFYGHFIGLHSHYGVYNVGGIKQFGLEKYRYEGELYGAGVTYGYHWILNKRWSLEAAMGVGYTRLEYDKYYCEKCGEKIGSYKTNYIGPTKASISLIYLLK